MIVSGSPPAGGLHGGGRDHLHEVVDHDVAQRADRVVEVAAVLDPEALRHRDLDALEAVPVPDRLEHRVGEAEVEELLEAHLPQEVVDPVDLRLVEVLVELGGERPGGRQVVAERLLDDDRAWLGETGVGQALDDRAEQERRDLEVEHRLLGALDRRAHPFVGGGVAEVALDVGQPGGEAVEHLLVDRLAGAHDRLAGVVPELVVGPVVDRHPDDRAREQPRALEAVQRSEGHHLGQVARDPEDHEDVRRLRLPSLVRGCRVAMVAPLAQSVGSHRDPAGRSCVNPAHVQSTTRLGPVLAGGQQREVDRTPGQRGRLALDRAPAVGLDHGGAPTDRRHRALVVVAGTARCPCRDEPGDVLPGVLAGLEGDRAELGRTWFVLVSVIQAMSPTANTSGWPATLRSGLRREAVAVLQLDAERLGERVGLQAGAPDQRVRLEHRPRLRG